MKNVKVWGIAVGLAGVSLLFVQCAKSGSSTSVATSSPSEIAAMVVSSSLNSGDNANQALAYEDLKRATRLEALEELFGEKLAHAGTVCPTWKNGVSGCSVNGSTLTLTLNNCSFTGGTATWNGTVAFTFTGVTPSCGANFPTMPASGASIQLELTKVTRASTTGLVLEHDTSTASGYTNPQYPTGASHGSLLDFVSSSSRTLTLYGSHVTGTYGSTNLWDHTVFTTSPMTVSIGSDSSGETRTASGTVTVYHNLVDSTATATFNSVLHSKSCFCGPISGTINTTFSGGNLSGKTESLTFNGCGSATYVGTNGSSTTLTIASCE